MITEKFKLIVDLHLFLIQDNGILLLRRFNTGYEDGKYSVVAGHLEADETVTEGMAREAKEEVGIIVNPKELRLVHVMHHKSNNQRMALFFMADSWTNEPKNVEPNKCDELGWFSIEKLPVNIVHYVEVAIEHYLNRSFFSEFGWKQ
jgi:8-oxo-dGTP diphosphatase